MIAVIDTNVLVSAVIFPGSIPFRSLQIVYTSGSLLKSYATITELTDVLTRKKFDRFLAFDDRVRFVLDVESKSKLISNIEPVQACRDPNDDKFLSLAIAGNADCIITGDDDLLTLNPFRGVAILTPQQFLERYESN